MRIVNSGNWFGQALELSFEDPESYKEWQEGISKMTTIAEQGGSYGQTYFVLVEGHRVIVHVKMDKQ